MRPELEPAIVIHRRRDRDGEPVNDRRLARALGEGRVVRVAPGSFVPADSWRALRPIERHRVRVIETVDRARGPLLIGYFAAAAIWGIDRIGMWPEAVDVIVPRTTGGRSSGSFRRRTATRRHIETVSWRGHELTTPAQTAMDLARISSFAAGVIALDQARWRRREGGPLTTLGEIERLASAEDIRRGSRRLRAAIDFSTDLSDSVRETEGRVLIDRLGFPRPVLQQRFLLRSGKAAFTDYFFEDHDHAAEFDGTGKYLDPELRRGLTAEAVLIAEKDRADELQRMVRAFSRWRTPAHRDPRILYDILTGAGLPSSRPRPPAGLRWG